MKKLRKNKGTVITALALAVITLVAGTFAWFTANKVITNTLKTGAPDVEIVEEFPDPTLTPGNETTKKVAAHNTGDTDLLVRVKFDEAWYDTNEDGTRGNANTTLATTNVEKLFDENAGTYWKYFDSTDAAQNIEDAMTSVGGYFYYQGALAPAKYTQLLLEGLKLNKDVGDEYKGKVYELTVNVEVVQASPAAAAVETWTEITSQEVLTQKIVITYDEDGVKVTDKGVAGLDEAPLTITEIQTPDQSE